MTKYKFSELMFTRPRHTSPLQPDTVIFPLNVLAQGLSLWRRDIEWWAANVEWAEDCDEARRRVNDWGPPCILYWALQEIAPHLRRNPLSLSISLDTLLSLTSALEQMREALYDYPEGWESWEEGIYCVRSKLGDVWKTVEEVLNEHNRG